MASQVDRPVSTSSNDGGSTPGRGRTGLGGARTGPSLSPSNLCLFCSVNCAGPLEGCWSGYHPHTTMLTLAGAARPGLLWGQASADLPIPRDTARPTPKTTQLRAPAGVGHPAATTREDQQGSQALLIPPAQGLLKISIYWPPLNGKESII